MSQSLQTVNHNNRLMEWSKRVEACRSSGLSVSQWRRENGVPVSTYFVWQRKVFEAVSATQEVCFAEVPVMQSAQIRGNAVAAMEVGDVRVEVYSGADKETLQAIIQAAKSHAE